MKNSLIKIFGLVMALSILVQVAALADNGSVATSFSDVKQGQWFYNDVMTLTGKGIITGVTTPVSGVGKYDPQGTVTLGQFLAISTRLVAKEHIKETDAKHWATPYYQAAVLSGLINTTDFRGSIYNFDAPISREDMAFILVNVAGKNGETLTIKSGIISNIADYNSISHERREAVQKAYSNGLLIGDDKGSFNPQKSLTRAEVATAFCRVMNYTKRPEVTVKDPGMTDPGTETKQREPVVLRHDDPDRPLPIAGDTFIDKDGNEVVLTETNGIVGYGQGLDLYSGMAYPNGELLTDGDIGSMYHGDKTYLGQPYMVDPETGEGHFLMEWHIIGDYELNLTKGIKNPKDGQRVGCWMVYYEKYKAWGWTGPR